MNESSQCDRYRKKTNSAAVAARQASRMASTTVYAEYEGWNDGRANEAEYCETNERQRKKDVSPGPAGRAILRQSDVFVGPLRTDETGRRQLCTYVHEGDGSSYGCSGEAYPPYDELCLTSEEHEREREGDQRRKQRERREPLREPHVPVDRGRRS